MKTHIRLTALTALLGVVATGLNASGRLTMVVTPNKSMAPATIRVRLAVEPATDNRLLDVVADSGNFYRSSQISLDGERAPQTIAVEFRNLPGGTYVVHSTLRDESGRQHASVSEEVTVISSAGDR